MFSSVYFWITMETINYTGLYTYEMYTNVSPSYSSDTIKSNDIEVMTILQILIAIIGIIGNCTVVFAFLNQKHLRKKVPNMFIINQVRYCSLVVLFFFDRVPVCYIWNRVFHKLDEIGNNANIGIRGFTAWNKIQWQNVTASGNRTQVSHKAPDSKSTILLTTLTWHVLFRRSLTFGSCTTWYLELDDLRRINRAWLYKEPKVSVLQANVKLV